MSLALPDLSKPAWLATRSAGDDIVMATVGRMVRNLRGYAFPGWSTAESRRAVVEAVLPVLRAQPALRGAWQGDMETLDYEPRRALLAAKLLTPCMAARRDGCRVLVSKNGKLCAMVNEEEHLVVHSYRSGAASETVLEELAAFNEALKDKLPLAYDPAYGYLTSIPGEAGDGLQLYRILHLPALSMAGMMTQVQRGMEALHVNIAPFFADGNDDSGHTYVFFSIPGPEGSRAELAEYFDSVTEHLVHRERQVRAKLAENDYLHLQDCIGRAYGLLRYAHRLSLKELRDATSVLRMATAIGYLDWEGRSVGALMGLRRLCHSAAVASALAPAGKEEEQPALRAAAVRRWLAENPHHFRTLYES